MQFSINAIPSGNADDDYTIVHSFTYSAQTAMQNYVLVLDNSALLNLRYMMDAGEENTQAPLLMFDLFQAMLKAHNITCAVTTRTISDWEQRHIITRPDELDSLYPNMPKTIRVISADTPPKNFSPTPKSTVGTSDHQYTRWKYNTDENNVSVHDLHRKYPNLFINVTDADLDIHRTVFGLGGKQNLQILSYECPGSEAAIYRKLIEDVPQQWDNHNQLWVSPHDLKALGLTKNGLGEKDLHNLVGRLSTQGPVLVVSDDVHAFGYKGQYDVQHLRTADRGVEAPEGGYPVSVISTKLLLQGAFSFPPIREELGLNNVPYLRFKPHSEKTQKQKPSQHPAWLNYHYHPNTDPISMLNILMLGAEMEKRVDAEIAREHEKSAEAKAKATNDDAIKKRVQENAFEYAIKDLLRSKNGEWTVSTDNKQGRKIGR